MGYQAYAGNGLLEGIASGLQLRNAYDKMQREKGLAAGLKRVAEGDESGWQQVAENSPETYMQKKAQDIQNARLQWDQEHRNDITPYQREMLGLQRKKLEADIEARKNSPEALTQYEKTLQMEQAKNRAEIEQKAAALEAGLPAFEAMAKDLNEIGKDVSYTGPQKAVDWLVRQGGFGATKGASARERYKQVVANELLPKLRETFGGQLSDAERESLLATLGNVDLSPEEREQAVKSFIESKKRQLDSYKRQLGVKSESKKEKDEVIDWRDL